MRTRQLGAAVVEFALVLIIFLTFLLGITDFARMLWTWNAANEATRFGARIAVVCDKVADSEAFILSRMRTFLPQLTATNVQFEWYASTGLGTPDAVNSACDFTNCTGVNVSITGLNYQWLSPIGAFASAVPMPNFSTYLPREIMGQDPDSLSVVCSAVP